MRSSPTWAQGGRGPAAIVLLSDGRDTGACGVAGGSGRRVLKEQGIPRVHRDAGRRHRGWLQRERGRRPHACASRDGTGGSAFNASAPTSSPTSTRSCGSTLSSDLHVGSSAWIFVLPRRGVRARRSGGALHAGDAGRVRAAPKPGSSKRPRAFPVLTAQVFRRHPSRDEGQGDQRREPDQRTTRRCRWASGASKASATATAPPPSPAPVATPSMSHEQHRGTGPRPPRPRRRRASWPAGSWGRPPPIRHPRPPTPRRPAPRGTSRKRRARHGSLTHQDGDRSQQHEPREGHAIGPARLTRHCRRPRSASPP
jgi:hypothetical protein